MVGRLEGFVDGCDVGGLDTVGAAVGRLVGILDGYVEGWLLGCDDGFPYNDGLAVGLGKGDEGLNVGFAIRT